MTPAPPLVEALNEYLGHDFKLLPQMPPDGQISRIMA